MKSQSIAVIILCILPAIIACANIAVAQNSETKIFSENISNQTRTDEILDDNSKLITGNYTPDQINEAIYRLYQEIQNSNSTEFKSSHEFTILIDLLCSNESIENAVEACDIVTELPLDDN
jgi:hypothetical protein